MSPSEYLLKYFWMKVPIVKDDIVERWDEVMLNHYILIVGHDKEKGTVTWDKEHPDNQAAHDAMLGKLMGHFAKKGAKLTVHVKNTLGGNDHVEFDNWKELWYHARKAYFGKGCPEEAQITLQLADRFDLLKGGTMQTYCDKYLGLDCNGFVGNYLVHGHRGGDWQMAEPMGKANLADTTIGAIMRKTGAAVARLEDLVPASTYMLGLVGPSGKIIEQVEGGMFGHICITQPSLKFDSAYSEGKSVRQVPTMFAVESTGGVGLTQKECQFVSAQDGIFTIKRLSHPMMPPLRFRVFRVL